jgi:ATP-dependent DNA helicase RecG
MVEFYDDRIEITNPGGLIGGMKIEDLGTKSQTRNPLLFDLIHRTGMIERMGSGIRRIRELARAAGLRPPRFESTGFFGICFERPKGPQNEPVNEIVNETVLHSRPVTD